MNNGRRVAIVQARLNSLRLPGKVLLGLGNYSVMSFIVQRLRQSRLIDEVVVATSDEKEDDAIIEECKKISAPYYRGSMEDVLQRILGAASSFGAAHVLRVTADCPFVDIGLIEDLWNRYIGEGYDYCGLLAGAGSTKFPGFPFPDGLDCEWMSIHALETAEARAETPSEREHATMVIWQQKTELKVGSLSSKTPLPMFRLTLDHYEDLILVKSIFDHFGNRALEVGFVEILEWLASRPNTVPNKLWIGKEGYETL